MCGKPELRFSVSGKWDEILRAESINLEHSTHRKLYRSHRLIWVQARSLGKLSSKLTKLVVAQGKVNLEKVESYLLVFTASVY